jgi:hypothetical protein
LADAKGVGLVDRQVRVPALGQLTVLEALEQSGAVGVGRRPRVERLLPRLPQLDGAIAHAVRVLDDLVGHGEGLLGVEPEQLLGRLDLVVTERGAVRAAGALGVRGGPGDDGAQADEAGTVRDGLCGLVGVPQGLDVLDVLGAAVGPVDGLDVPAVRLVARRDVLGEGDVGVVLDRDAVVVPQQRQVAQLLRAGQRGRLGRDTLLQVAVGRDDVHVVVEGALTGSGVRVEQAALAAGGHREADGVRDALAERAGRDLDAGRVVVLGVTRRLAAPGAQALEVVERHGVAGQVQLDVLREARVSAREDEAVASCPVRIAGVVAHELLVVQVGHRGQAHRGAGVAVADLLHGVSGQQSDGVHRQLVEVCPLQGGGSGRHSMGS